MNQNRQKLAPSHILVLLQNLHYRHTKWNRKYVNVNVTMTTNKHVSAFETTIRWLVYKGSLNISQQREVLCMPFKIKYVNVRCISDIYFLEASAFGCCKWNDSYNKSSMYVPGNFQGLIHVRALIRWVEMTESSHRHKSLLF